MALPPAIASGAAKVFAARSSPPRALSRDVGFNPPPPTLDRRLPDQATSGDDDGEEEEEEDDDA